MSKAQIEEHPAEAAHTVRPPGTKSIYVVLMRFGTDYWASMANADSIEKAVDQARIILAGVGRDGIAAVRYVRIDSLPIDLPEPEKEAGR